MIMLNISQHERIEPSRYPASKARTKMIVGVSQRLCAGTAYLLRLITALTRGASQVQPPFLNEESSFVFPRNSRGSRALNCYKLPHRFAK